ITPDEVSTCEPCGVPNTFSSPIFPELAGRRYRVVGAAKTEERIPSLLASMVTVVAATATPNNSGWARTEQVCSYSEIRPRDIDPMCRIGILSSTLGARLILL